MLFNKLNRKYLGFDDTYFILIGIPIWGFIIPLVFFDLQLDPTQFAFYHQWIESTLYVTVNWLIARKIIIYFRKRLQDDRKIVHRLLYTTIVYFILSTIFATFTLSFILDSLGFATSDDPSLVDANIATVTAFVTITSIYETIYFFSKWKKSVIEMEQLQKEMLQSHINSLRAQVNPHFLFNSLNALSNLIESNPEKAVLFTEKLSQTYRYILQMHDTELIKVHEELSFLDAYKFLNEVRFGDSISFELNIDDEARNKLITPLALQILVENAIKHNIVSKSKPLKIELFNQNGSIVIKNNLQLKTQDIISTKTGLSNIERRYSFITDKAIDIISTNDYFIVVLPLIDEKTLV